MSMKTLSEAIVARLAGMGVKNPMLPDDPKRQTPNGPYTVVYPNPGHVYAYGYDGGANRGVGRWSVMVVSNSRQGVLDMVEDVRAALTHFSPGGTASSGRLSEEFAGPVLSVESAPLDLRVSLTLNYVMTTHRGEI